MTIEAETETRAWSISLDESPEQTARIMKAHARMAENTEPPPDLQEWVDAQWWLELHGERRVVVPYAEELMCLIPPAAVRLRRDFPKLLGAIKVHAILHQQSRKRTDDGAIIATLDDYEVVRDLVGEMLSEQVSVSVNSTVRETVEAVDAIHVELRKHHSGAVPTSAIRAHLNLDKSNVSRRLKKAEQEGFIYKVPFTSAKEDHWAPTGIPMPEEGAALLPVAQALAQPRATTRN